MRNLALLVTLLALASGRLVQAQQLRLEFAEGHVTIKAENTPLRAILAEWVRQGGTRMVNAERVTSSPVTLDLTNTPERQALDILLRGVAGYIIGLREVSAGPVHKGQSIFDRVHILPTPAVSPAVSVAADPPQVRPSRAPVPTRPRDSAPDTDDDLAEDVGAGVATSRPAMPPNPGLPGRAPNPAQIDVEDDAGRPAPQPPRGNPFSPVTGASRPGVTIPADQSGSRTPLPRD